MSSAPKESEGKVKNSKEQIANTVRMITVLWLIVHFLLTMLYVYPANPVQARLQPLLNATIGRYFSQGWNLFAPEPDTTDVVLLVRPLTPHEYNVVQIQGLPSDGWYDLSSPLWTKLQNSRFSAYGKLSRAVSKALYAYFELIDNQRVFSASFKEMNNSKAIYAAHDVPQGQQEQLMVRAASVFCKDIGQKNAKYVALMAREIFTKPWSQRATSDPQVIKNSLLGVYPIDQSVEDAHIYQMGA